MRTAVLFNPNSGSGRAARLAEMFISALRAAGHDVVVLPTHADGAPRPALTPDDLAGVGLLVVVGGDGTVHRAAPIAAQAGVPVYHAPAGTENLFARHFGMTADPALLLRALQLGRRAPMDIGLAGRRPFLLMASVGPDAGVIHRLHHARRGVIRQWSYAGPIFREIAAPRLPLLTVLADGAPWLNRQRGLLVIGNSPHYAWRLNPVRTAEADDGKLDAVFFPADSIADTLGWAARLMLQRSGPLAGAPAVRGTTFEVRADEPADALIQMDGEVGPKWPGRNSIVFGIAPHRLEVLVP